MPIKLPFFKKKENKESFLLQQENVPNHVAIIMDGNGRWAKKRGLPRVAGHKEGMNVVKKIVSRSSELNVKVLTLYAFSTENWKRPEDEVNFLMRLPEQFLTTYLKELIEKNVRVRTIGDTEALPQHTKNAVDAAIEKTKHNTGLTLNFALNYGSRNEIVKAIQQIAESVKNGSIETTDINESVIGDYLYTNTIQDPDLLIRTSGEIRLSNFLLWQLAYTEFWFTDVLWPDFNETLYEKALYEYQQRKRRYGGI